MGNGISIIEWNKRYNENFCMYCKDIKLETIKNKYLLHCALLYKNINKDNIKNFVYSNEPFDENKHIYNSMITNYTYHNIPYIYNKDLNILLALFIPKYFSDEDFIDFRNQYKGYISYYFIITNDVALIRKILIMSKV